MNCPKCGKREQARVKVCPGCGEAYASEDLQAMRQLEYLLLETTDWEGVEPLRSPYQEKLEKLRARLVKAERPEAAIVSPPSVVETPPIEKAPPEPEPEAAPPTHKVTPDVRHPPAEKVPFDEWLLSERNIKFALYGGGLLLFIAGIIFVGINWARLPGPVKFAVTLMITGLTFLGGYLLHRRPAYRLGGVALLGLACGFLTLNFAVLQIYVMGPEGLRDDVMWLIASPLCLIVYFLIGYWTRHELFAYISIAALISLVASTLVVAGAQLMVTVLASALFGLALLIMALSVKRSSLADFTYRPLLFVSQGVMPLVIVYSLPMWILKTGCIHCPDGSPWLALITLVVGVIFYAITSLTYQWLWSRWVAVTLFSLTGILTLLETGIDDTIAGLILMVLALVELLSGYWVEKREGQLEGALPLYVLAGGLALFVTGQALGETDALIKVLFGDVVLLGVAAWIFQDYRWVYGAVWLFVLPVYLLIDTYVNEYAIQGLLMGLLGLNYVVVGFVLGRRERNLGWPFLTAAAFLSLVVGALSWSEPWIFALSTAVIAILYGLVALWLEWPVLLLPALFALDLVVLGINRAAYELTTPIEPALVISYAFTGGALLLGGLALRRSSHSRWAFVLYLLGAVDLALAYAGGLLIGYGLGVGMSVTMAAFLLSFAWLERDLFMKMQLPGVLTYLAAGVVLAGLVFLLDTLGGSRSLELWPVYVAGLCALYIILAWFLRRDPFGPVYGLPLRYAGLVLMGIPLIGAVAIFEPILGAVAFAIAGLALAVDAVLHRSLIIAYLAAGAYLVVIWAVLWAFEVSELLAYIAPLGFGLLGMGWNERLQGRMTSYWLATMLGLAALMGATFVQSIINPDGYYALLLLLESVLAFVWGIFRRVRCYIQVAGLALVANAVVQLGPGFFELSRWIQIALTGGLLLGGGLIALFKREEILATRQKMVGGWRQFEP